MRKSDEHNGQDHRGGTRKAIDSITIVKLPDKIEYAYGEPLELFGIVVQANLKNGGTEDITIGCEYSPAHGTPLETMGPVTVKVSYQNGKETFETSFGVEVVVKIVSWDSGTNEEIVKMVQAHKAGKIDLRDYWPIGATRVVHLPEIPSPTSYGSGLIETQPEQDIELVLMSNGGLHYTSGEECIFTVGMKDCLVKAGPMHGATYSVGWSGCDRRTWCNNDFKAKFPASLMGAFSEFTFEPYGSSATTDIFAIFAEKQVFGRAIKSLEEPELEWVSYYMDSANRLKRLGTDAAAYTAWFEASKNYPKISGERGNLACAVENNGDAVYADANASWGISLVCAI